MFNQFYRGKKILVTGHTGFKGSWMSLWLKELGAEVAGLSLSVPTQPSHFSALKLEKKMHHFLGDVRKLEDIKKVLNDFKPDLVFHLAAEAIVFRCYENPVAAFDTNVMGTVNMLEALRTCPSVKAAVMITSDKCYENVEWEWGYRESDRLGGKDPYSASKACAEIAISSFARSFFRDGAVKIASTRAGNVIGGGDWASDRIIPDAVRAWSEGKNLTIRSPQSTRPWQHVLEPLSGYLWLGSLLASGRSELHTEAFNFGPSAADFNYSVKELLDEMKKYWKGEYLVQIPVNQQKEAGLLKLSCDKAATQLKWKSTLDFPTTVQMTAQWYRAYYDQENVEALGIKQLKEFADKARAQQIAWA